MAKVYVFKKDLTAEEVEELVLLLEAAGIPSDDIVLVDDVDSPTEDCENDVFAFLLTSDGIAAVEEAISKVPDGGRRAICVWPEGAPDASQPPEVAKYSYSTISWSADRMRAAVADDDVTFCEMASGKPITPPETERNECD